MLPVENPASLNPHDGDNFCAKSEVNPATPRYRGTTRIKTGQMMMMMIDKQILQVSCWSDNVAYNTLLLLFVGGRLLISSSGNNYIYIS